MGKTRFAEYHFRRALEINPSNVVIYCCVGTVGRFSVWMREHERLTGPTVFQIVEKRGDLEKALNLYEKALEITPANKMARFRKARVLIGMKQYTASVE